MSIEPLHPTAEIKSTLGRCTEVGTRATVLEVALSDYPCVANRSEIAYAALGKFCSMAAMSRNIPGNHPMHRASQSHFTYRASTYGAGEPDNMEFFIWRRAHRVGIGHDVGIGRGAISFPGPSGGGGAAIAAGAVVTKDCPPYLVAGNPARSIRQRYGADVAQRVKTLAWWDWPHDCLRAAPPDFRALSAEAFLDRHERSCERTPSEPTAIT